VAEPSAPHGAAPEPASARRTQDLEAAEEWFRQQGLPWFVDAVDERIRELLSGRRLWFAMSAVTVLALLAGWLTQRTSGSWSSAVMVSVSVALALLLAYAGGPLKVAVMARWAAQRVLSALDLLVLLVTRALPLLLLFMTFFFINTEVWQVTAALSRSALYAVVVLFALVGVAFLLTRLPEEVRRVERAAAEGDGVARACVGTPLETQARMLTGDPVGAAAADLRAETPLSRPQEANLVLVLLVTQAIQVTLLTVAVFGFFVGFGLMTMDSAVVELWLGHAPTPIAWDLGSVHVELPVSTELYQVSIFLAAFGPTAARSRWRSLPCSRVSERSNMSQ